MAERSLRTRRKDSSGSGSNYEEADPEEVDHSEGLTTQHRQTLEKAAISPAGDTR